MVVPGSDIGLLYRSMCTAVMREISEKGLIVAYDDLPAAVWDFISGHFNIPLAAPEVDAMKARSKFHSKAPPDRLSPFSPDSLQKRTGLPRDIALDVQAAARSVYLNLTALSFRSPAI